MSPPPVMVMLDGCTVQDLARALQYSHLAISNTSQPGLFVVRQAPRPLPSNVVEFESLALLRRQAE
jgi:hypothetical protein